MLPLSVISLVQKHIALNLRKSLCHKGLLVVCAPFYVKLYLFRL